MTDPELHPRADPGSGRESGRDLDPGAAPGPDLAALEFTVTVHQNKHIAVGTRDVDAVLEIVARAAPSGGAARPPTGAEVIVLDTSESMAGNRLKEATRAARAALGALRDGTLFAVVSGSETAQMIFPLDERVVQADPESRAAAGAALDRVEAHGNTSMSTWLRQVRVLMSRSGVQHRHAVLLTDGHNTEPAEYLAHELERSAGRFTCDAVGVGENWNPQQIQRITDVLLGDWEPIARPEQLPQAFRKLIDTSMRKQVAEATLRLTLHPKAALTRLAQVYPRTKVSTAFQREGREVALPLGRWAAGEQRSYRLRIEAAQEDFDVEDGGEAMAARAEVLVADWADRPVCAAKNVVRVVWTTNAGAFAPINEVVAGFDGEVDLARTVNAAVVAIERNEPDAEQKVGRAVAMAHRYDRPKLIEVFTRVARIIDAALGVVELMPRSLIRNSDIYALKRLLEDTRSHSAAPRPADRADRAGGRGSGPDARPDAGPEAGTAGGPGAGAAGGPR